MASYTDEQKSKIMQMPAAVLLNSIIADTGSAVVGMREFMAGEKFISEAGAAYPGNALVQDMIRDVNLPKLEETVKPMFSIGDLSAVRAECQKKIDDGLAVLANDGEGNQFKKFLVGLAEKVVNAAGEGFFGTRGDGVSIKEAAYVNQLKQQLSVAPTS